MNTCDAVAVMARAPVPGQVKRRLAARLGDSAAAQIYRAMLRDCLELATKATSSSQVVLCYTPSDAFEAGDDSLSALWNGRKLPQCEGDIGRRMMHCLESLRSGGAGRVLLIGSDAPDIPLEYFKQAFVSLQTSEVVFGPAADGGFYLIGASGALDETLFRDVRWSTQSTLAAVLANTERLQLRVELLPAWQDVDEIKDLQALASRLQSGAGHAPYTRRVLASHNLLEH